MTSEHEEICPYCDPDLFVVYGNCRKCGQMKNPPLLRNASITAIPSIGFCTEKGSEKLKKLIESQRDFNKNGP